MSRKQVLVQLEDTLVDRLDAYAAAHDTNRSAVLRTAAEQLLAAEDRRLDIEEADRLLVESYTRLPQDQEWAAWADEAQADAYAGAANEWAAFDPQRNPAGEPDGC